MHGKSIFGSRTAEKVINNLLCELRENCMMDYQTIVDEVKNILEKRNNEINQVSKEQNEDVGNSMTEEQWNKYVLQIMSYDFLRIKSISDMKKYI